VESLLYQINNQILVCKRGKAKGIRIRIATVKQEGRKVVYEAKGLFWKFARWLTGMAGA